MSTPTPTHSNRQARERALELLYEAEAKDVHPADVVAVQPVAPHAYAAVLAEGVGDHRHLLDHVIAARAKGWTIARMPSVDRAVLRLATYELAFEPDQPLGVVLDEAVELARQFSTDSSPKFVNGVLSAVATDVRDDGRWAGAARPAVLVVDVDGVLRHWDTGALAAADDVLGVAAGTLARVAFEPDRLHRAMTGDLTADAWGAEIGAAIAASDGCDAGEVERLWAAQPFTVDDAVRELVAGVQAAGRPTAAFSNASTRLESDLAAAGLADVLDTIVNSSRLGLAKPDPASFAAAAGAVGTAPADCLFVDDRPENVDGALAAGMPAVHFTGPDRLRATLWRTGLLPRA